MNDIISVTPIIFYNVFFTLFAQSEYDEYKISYFYKIYKAGQVQRLADISGWCKNHDIQYDYEVHWRTDFPFRANVHNLLYVLKWLVFQK